MAEPLSDVRPTSGEETAPDVRLVLVDDHEAVRFGIRRALTHPEAAGLRVVGEARDAAGLVPRLSGMKLR